MWWTSLGSVLLAFFTSIAGWLTNKWLLRAAALAVAVALVFELTAFSYQTVVNLFGTAAGQAISAMSTGDGALVMQTFRCLIPSSSGAALSIVMSTFIQCVIVIWTRRIIFMKLT